MSDVKETIRQYILTTYLPGESAANLRDDTPLRTSGILDSLATLAWSASSRRSSGSSSRRTRRASTPSTASRTSRRWSRGRRQRRASRDQLMTVTHLAEYLEASAARWPDRTAVVDPAGWSLTYAELNRQADALAGFLADARRRSTATGSASCCRRASRPSCRCSAS